MTCGPEHFYNVVVIIIFGHLKLGKTNGNCSKDNRPTFIASSLCPAFQQLSKRKLDSPGALKQFFGDFDGEEDRMRPAGQNEFDTTYPRASLPYVKQTILFIRQEETNILQLSKFKCWLFPSNQLVSVTKSRWDAWICQTYGVSLRHVFFSLSFQK